MPLVICQQCLEPFEVKEIKASQPRKFCAMACSNRSRAKYPDLSKAEYDKIYRVRNIGREDLKVLRRASTILRMSKMGESLQKAMLIRAKARAEKKGIPFNLELSDIAIPSHCPILGVKLEVSFKKSGGERGSPSLDRIIPSLGYVKGNIMVISKRANQIKTDASLEEIEKVASFLQKLFKL